MKCAADAAEGKTESCDSWGGGSGHRAPVPGKGSSSRPVEGAWHSRQLWSNVPFSGGWRVPVIHSRFPQKASGGARCSPREGAPDPHCVGGDGVKPKPVQELKTEWDTIPGLQAPTAHQQQAGHQPGHEGLLPTSGQTRHPCGEDLSVGRVPRWGQRRGRCPWGSFVTSSSNQHRGISNGEPPQVWGTPPSDQPFQANFCLPLTALSVL